MFFMKITLRVKRLSEETKLPAYAYPGDAAFDLLAVEEAGLAPGERKDIPTGLSIEIPEGYAGLIWDKSGIAIKNGVKVLGGVIDAGYRGEVRVGVVNLSEEPYVFEKGHKVAQMIIQKIEQADIVEVEELSETDRGGRGFGSSGK
jgi:dUTP pyrophosphatase